MNALHPARLILAATLIISSSFLSAETTELAEGEIWIPVGSQSSELRTDGLPNHGQTMTDVLQSLGQPEATSTIGTPAISRWSYPDKKLTVYFEGKRVLRSVVNPYSN